MDMSKISVSRPLGDLQSLWYRVLCDLLWKHNTNMYIWFITYTQYRQYVRHYCVPFHGRVYHQMLPVFMMTSSNGTIFRVTGPLCGEFTGHRWIPLTKASDAEYWCFSLICALYKRLSKQPWGWWFETPSNRTHYDVIVMFTTSIRDYTHSFLRGCNCLSTRKQRVS